MGNNNHLNIYEGEGWSQQTLLRKEDADFSGSQADMCLQCYATDAAKKRNWIQRSTGMYKKEGSLQNALVVGLIKTVHLKKLH